MGKSKSILYPKMMKKIIRLGENIKLARLRRGYSMEQVCERAGIARSTLGKLENGKAGVGIDTLAKVLFVLGLENDLGRVAYIDELGRNIQDASLLNSRGNAYHFEGLYKKQN